MDQEESHLENARQREAINRWRWTMGLSIGGAFAFSLVAAPALYAIHAAGETWEQLAE
jgi:hypothetical protein